MTFKRSGLALHLWRNLWLHELADRYPVTQAHSFQSDAQTTRRQQAVKSLFSSSTVVGNTCTETALDKMEQRDTEERQPTVLLYQTQKKKKKRKLLIAK